MINPAGHQKQYCMNGFDTRQDSRRSEAHMMAVDRLGGDVFRAQRENAFEESPARIKFAKVLSDMEPNLTKDELEEIARCVQASCPGTDKQLVRQLNGILKVQDDSGALQKLEDLLERWSESNGFRTWGVLLEKTKEMRDLIFQDTRAMEQRVLHVNAIQDTCAKEQKNASQEGFLDDVLQRFVVKLKQFSIWAPLLIKLEVDEAALPAKLKCQWNHLIEIVQEVCKLIQATTSALEAALFSREVQLGAKLRKRPSDKGLAGVASWRMDSLSTHSWSKLVKKLGVPDGLSSIEASLKYWRDGKTKNPSTWEFLLDNISLVLSPDDDTDSFMNTIFQEKEWTNVQSHLQFILQSKPTEAGYKLCETELSNYKKDSETDLTVHGQIDGAIARVKKWWDGLEMLESPDDGDNKELVQPRELPPKDNCPFSDKQADSIRCLFKETGSGKTDVDLYKFSNAIRKPEKGSRRERREARKANEEKWLQVAEWLCGWPHKESQYSLKPLLEWRYKRQNALKSEATWECLLECLSDEGLSTVKTKVEKQIEKKFTLTELDPFPVKEVSDKFNQEESKLSSLCLIELFKKAWEREPNLLCDKKTGRDPPSPYPKWLDACMIEGELQQISKETRSKFIDFKRELLAYSGLKCFRQKKKEEEKRIKLPYKVIPGLERTASAVPPFSEDVDTPEDLFAIVAHCNTFHENLQTACYLSYTLFAALWHELHKKGYDLSTYLFENCHILHYACYYGNLVIVKFLLRWEIDADVRSPSIGMTGLHMLCGSNYIVNDYVKHMIDIVDLLCNHGASLFAETHDRNWTPLFMAINGQKQELVQHLLYLYETRCENMMHFLQHKDHEGNTVLHLAARVGQVDIIREIRFYALKADQMLKERNRLSGDVSTQRSHWFKLLTNQNAEQQTPIHYAAQHNLPCMEEILEGPKNMEIALAFYYTHQDVHGWCPLDYAAKTKHKETFKLLWEAAEKCKPPQAGRLEYDFKHIVRNKNGHPDWNLLKHQMDRLPEALLPSMLLQYKAADKTSANYRPKDKKDFETLSLNEILHAPPGVNRKDHLDVVNKFLDGTVFGNEVVIGKVFNSDPWGRFDEESTKESITLHDLLTSEIPIWGHQAVNGWIASQIDWFKYGWVMLWLFFLCYLMFVGLLFGALYLAAKSPLSVQALALQYNGSGIMHANDITRMVMEFFCFLYCLGLLIQIVYELVMLRQHYFKLFTVYLRIALCALMLALIVCRVSAVQNQWIVASLLFLVSMFLSTDYLIIFSLSNVYLLALWVIVRRDILRFLVIATVVSLAFTGGLYFALRGEQPALNTIQPVPCSANDSTSSDNGTCVPTGAININVPPVEAFSLNELFLKTLQVVTEGTTITYDIYGIYTILMYLVFVVIILLLMINALIAQISHSYDEAKRNAEQICTYAKARFLLMASPVCWRVLSCNCKDSSCQGNYHAVCTSCRIPRKKMIWINSSCLDSDVDNKVPNFMKAILRSILTAIGAVFAPSTSVVTKTTQERQSRISSKRNRRDRSDSFTVIIESPHALMKHMDSNSSPISDMYSDSDEHQRPPLDLESEESNSV